MNKEDKGSTFGALESHQLYQPYFEKRENDNSNLSYVLLSGGPDSATVLYQVSEKVYILVRTEKYEVFMLISDSHILNKSIKLLNQLPNQ